MKSRYEMSVQRIIYLCVCEEDTVAPHTLDSGYHMSEIEPKPENLFTVV